MLTQKLLDRLSCPQLSEARSGRNATSGGSSETDVNEPTSIPTGAPSGSVAVMMQTPVGYWPSTCRNRAGLAPCCSIADVRDVMARSSSAAPLRLALLRERLRALLSIPAERIGF